MQPPFPGRIRDPRKFTQDTGIKFPAEDLINSPQAAQLNTEVLFKTNPATWPGSCQHPAPPLSPPTSSLLQQPPSLLPLLPAVPFLLRPVSGCPFWACSRSSGQVKPSWPTSSAWSMGAQPGASTSQSEMADSLYFLKSVALGFLSIDTSPGFPLLPLATFSPPVALLPCTRGGYVFLLPPLHAPSVPSSEHQCVRAQLLQSCPTRCDPVDCSPPGSSVHEILQARILEWVAMPSSRGSSRPRDRTHISCVSCTAGGFFTH